VLFHPTGTKLYHSIPFSPSNAFLMALEGQAAAWGCGSGFLLPNRSPVGVGLFSFLCVPFPPSRCDFNPRRLAVSLKKHVEGFGQQLLIFHVLLGGEHPQSLSDFRLKMSGNAARPYAGLGLFGGWPGGRWRNKRRLITLILAFTRHKAFE
jgi:hypothetical protein